MNQGWIRAYRKLKEHWVWQDKPFSRGQAWIDLLLTVNHENKKAVVDGKKVTIKRGSCITSIRKLSESWGWSRTKTVSFLDALESENMISRNSDTKKTVISVINYDNFQGSQPTKRPQKSTNKNDKNDKNEKNTAEPRELFPSGIENQEDLEALKAKLRE